MLKLWAESANGMGDVTITYNPVKDTMEIGCDFVVPERNLFQGCAEYRFTPTTVDVATLSGCIKANAIGPMLDYLQERVSDPHGQNVIAKAMEFACW